LKEEGLNLDEIIMLSEKEGVTGTLVEIQKLKKTVSPAMNGDILCTDALWEDHFRGNNGTEVTDRLSLSCLIPHPSYLSNFKG